MLGYSLLIWLFPYVIINFILLSIFWENKSFIKDKKKTTKYILRETIGEIRYIIPLFNWFLMFNLIRTQDFIKAYLKEALIKKSKK